MLFEFKRWFWFLLFATLELDTQAVKDQDLIEEKNARHDERKSEQLLEGELFVAKAWLQEEENPYHEYPGLLNNCTIGGGTEFGDAHSTSIE